MTSPQCSRCGRVNPAEARFCIYCGSPLTEESRATPTKSQSIEDEIRQLHEMISRITYRLVALEGVPGIEDEVRQLWEMVKRINSRLAALESRRGRAPTPPPTATPEQIEPEIIKPVPGVAPTPAEMIPPPEEIPGRAAEIPGRVAEKRPAKPREWEQILGGSWLARIGVLAIIIGIGFFLKYAFDNNWLGPQARVILGTVAGLVMLWLGFHWRKRYPIMTQVLSGGGIAVLYLSIFASFATYHLVNVYVAVALLLITSVLSTILALRYNSMALAIIGILGAFFAPYILGAFGGGLGERTRGQAIQLLAYLVVVDIGVLLLSTFRNWHWFTMLALACSLLTYGAWYAQFDNRVSTTVAETGITLIFLSFAGTTYLFNIVRRRVPEVFDYILMSVTAAAYVGISLRIMWDDYRSWLGGFVLLLVIFYGLLAYLAYKRTPESGRLSAFSLAIAIILLTVAIPVQFGDHAPTTIAWALEMAAFVWLSFVLKIPLLRYCAYAVFMAMFWRLLIFDTSVDITNFKPVLNARFLAFIIGIAATYLTIFTLWRRRASITREWRLAAPLLLIAVSFLSIWIISYEVWQSFTNSLRTADPAGRQGLENAQNLSLTAVWAIYAVIGLIIGIWRKWRYVRIGSLALLVVPIIKVFVYDVFHLETSYRIGAFVGLGLLLLASAYLYQRYSKVIKGVFTNK